MLTAHYKIFGIPKLRLFSSIRTHYVNRLSLCSALWQLRFVTLAQMNADTLVTVIAVSNKLYFISDSAFYQNRSLYLLPASMKLWQANLLASSELSDPL